MHQTRWHHTASVLTNGKVLVTGGFSDTSLNSTELYDPSTGNWTTTGSMHHERHYHTAAVLPNGKVLVTGGYEDNDVLFSAELYYPSIETWTITTSMT
jgi:WD40 repeat protein